jgi:hypothetical protein
VNTRDDAAASETESAEGYEKTCDDTQEGATEQ